MATEKASEQAINTFLNRFADWSVNDNKLRREYVFTDFIQAFGFMAEAAILAEKSNHHPEWFNVYSKVIVDLSTHEAGGITDRDFNLAQKMEAVAIRRLAVP